MANLSSKTWERLRLLPFVKKSEQDGNAKTVNSSRKNSSRKNSSELASIKVKRFTSASVDIPEDDITEDKGYLHALARANNVEAIKEFALSVRDKLQISVQLEVEHGLLNETEADKKIDTLLKDKLNELDEESLTALHYAARYNNFEAVKILVDYGADCDATDKNNVTPLHAIARGRKMTTKLDGKLMNQTTHCKLSEKDKMPFVDESARLETAVCVLNNETEERQEQIMNYLILHDANPNAADNYRQTPLFYAAFRGNESAVRILLNSKEIYSKAITNSNWEDNHKQRPLHLASNFGWLNICKLLIQAEADVFATNDRNRTALHFASANGDCGIMELLIQTALIKGDNRKITEFLNQKSHDESPLTLAISNGKKEAVQKLLDKEANISIKQKRLNGVLHVASSVRGSKDMSQIMQILVDKGAPIDVKNMDAQTPLHVACLSNNVPAVEFLIQRKADIEARDRFGLTPFLLTCQMKTSEENEKILKCLIDNGANMNTSDKFDKTAAALATKVNNTKALELVLSRCENIANKVDKKSNTPLHIAARYGHFEAIKILVDNGSMLDAKNEGEETPLHIAVKNGHFKATQCIMECDEYAGSGIIRDEDQNSNTALHLAAKAGYSEIVELLLLSAKDLLSARNFDHFTPLHCAAAYGNKQTVQVLLDYGAKVNNVEDEYTTALHEACRQGNCDIVTLLLNYGAYIDAIDGTGRNCLEVAIDCEQENVAKLLVGDPKWKDGLKHSRKLSIAHPFSRTTPLRDLIKTMPNVAKIVLDKCITTEKHPKLGEPHGLKTYNYELLDDVYSSWISDTGQNDATNAQTPRTRETLNKKDIYNGFDENGQLRPSAKLYTTNIHEIRKYHPIMIMVAEENIELLGHDLVTSLLNYKWKRYGQIIYYTGLFLYLLFIMCLTHYAVNVPPPYTHAPDGLLDLPNGYCFNESLRITYANNIPIIKWDVRAAQYLTAMFAAFNLLKELIQLYYRGKHYSNWSNVVEILLYIFAFVFVLDWNSCSRIVGYRMSNQWMWGVRAVILAWINLVLMVRKFPLLGIYVVMFTDVLRTFAKFFVVFFLFIIAFALGFFMLFQNQAPFSSFPRTIVKTLVMMVGEFEYNAIFYSSQTEVFEKVNYPQSSHIIFFIFAIIMTILIMNLLVGLAVDDIKTVKGTAVLKRQAMKAELLFEIEFAVPDIIRRRWMIGRRKLSEKKPSLFFKRWLYILFPKVKSETPTDAVLAVYGDKIKEDQEKQEEEIGTATIMEEVARLKRSVNKIESNQEQILDMLHSMYIQMNLPNSERSEP